MTQYTIFADYHIGHPFALEPDFTFSKNTVFLGDNFDLNNASKKNLESALKLRQDTIAKCKEADGIYLCGNHSLEPLDYSSGSIAVRDSVLFTHGDIVDWSHTRAKLYRKVFSPGKKQYIWHMIKGWRKIFPDDTLELTKKDIYRAIKLTQKYNCETIVMGHFHPKNGLMEIKKENIRIFVVPRGKTVIDV